MRVAWTGQRPEVFADPDGVAAAIGAVVAELSAAAAAPPTCLCGGQRGVDLWAAEAGLRHGWPLRLFLPLPPEAFSRGWEPLWARRLEAAVAAAIEVRVFAAEGMAGYTLRNRALADEADLLVAVTTGPPQAGGGTAETLAFARSRGAPVRELQVGDSGWDAPPGSRGL